MIHEKVCDNFKECIDTVDADFTVVYVLTVASLVQKVQQFRPLVLRDVDASNSRNDTGNGVANKSTVQ